ncbi:hypothetical protein [Paenibacillus xylanivorans]|uniref:Uncharacterized protein n=1 Tax=Paenibacillus xylanivorans TaxID=1705561 RepID=A0A0M9BIH5_9BACL|nr:hypothetical protein [Paenibacillus xylanivorans]KOY12609.1 hypothetical protein AMS66_29810 [Paenibacillus xylanivorans]
MSNPFAHSPFRFSGNFEEKLIFKFPRTASSLFIRNNGDTRIKFSTRAGGKYFNEFTLPVGQSFDEVLAPFNELTVEIDRDDSIEQHLTFYGHIRS